MLKKWLARAIVAVGLGTFMLGGSSANAGFTLGDLLAGTYTGPNAGPTGFQITFDGLSFNFNPNQGGFYSPFATGGAVAPTAFQITVTPTIISGVDSLIFSSGWVAGAGQTVDSALGYTVTVLPGARPISDLHLDVTGTAIGTGFYIVSDSFPGTGLPTLGVSSITSSSAVLNLSPAVTFLDVHKDIFLSGGTAGLAALSIVTQGYSRPVPEPGSIALVLIGSCGAFGLLRRRKHNV